jgi:ribose transport system permease protein
VTTAPSHAHRLRQRGTAAGLLLLCAGLWAATPHFLTVSNLLNVLEQTALNAVVAVGMTYVIISGGIDLSVGSVLAFAGIALGRALEAGMPAPLAVLVALVVGRRAVWPTGRS